MARKFVPEGVLAVDPGLRSGWAMWAGGGLFTCGIEDPDQTMDLMAEWTAAWGRRGLLVMEKFTITAQTGRFSPQPEPMELIGVGKYLARVNGCVFTLQTPADAKRFVPDVRLKAVDMYREGREDHARDAARHLVLRLAKEQLITFPTTGGAP